MIKVVCIIQARRGSSRLPDKVLLPLGGQMVLTHVIKRCKAIKSVDEVVLATVDNPYEDILEEVALSAGASVYRGSEQDVLDRYYQAAVKAKATHVMRITSDCPLIDPDVCNDLVLRVIDTNSDYGGNGSFIHGLDCEVFTMEALEKAHKTAANKEDREHVTLWMKRDPSVKQIHLALDDTKGYSKYRLTLDYPDDYELLSRIFAEIKDQIKPWREVVAIIENDPRLLEINEKSSILWKEATSKIYKNAEAIT